MDGALRAPGTGALWLPGTDPSGAARVAPNGADPHLCLHRWELTETAAPGRLLPLNPETTAPVTEQACHSVCTKQLGSRTTAGTAKGPAFPLSAGGREVPWGGVPSPPC